MHLNSQSVNQYSLEIAKKEEAKDFSAFAFLFFYRCDFCKENNINIILITFFAKFSYGVPLVLIILYNKINNYVQEVTHMEVCKSIKEFISLYFDKSGNYEFKDLEFKESSKWDELVLFLEKEAPKNPDFYALLSNMYLVGRGVQKSLDFALSYAQDGITKKSKYCLWFIGYIYSLGYLGGRDEAKAFEFYLKAAQAGVTNCMFLVGRAYATGVGVGVDYEQTKYWYEQAIKYNNKNALFNYANAFYNGTYVTRNYPQAFEFYRRAVQYGHIEATCNLGLLYYHGLGVDRNVKKGIEYLKLAADNDNPPALYKLGTLYFNGENVKKDEDMGLDLLYRAAELGSQGAAKFLDNNGF